LGRRRHLRLLRVLVELLANETISFFLFINALLAECRNGQIKLTFALVLLDAAVCQSKSNAMGARCSELSAYPPPPTPSTLPLLLPAELPSDRSRLCSSPPVASASHAH
jgi:hypothetical protein